MRVFVYGTLQRGRRLHGHLVGQHFVANAATLPDYVLFKVDWYPGLVDAPSPGAGNSVRGEVWEIDDATLAVLDEVEDIESGLYERKPIRLQPPFDRDDVIAYFYLGDVEGCPDCGDRW